MAGATGAFRLNMFSDGRGGNVWQWVLTSESGQTMATSERFADRESAERVIQWIKDNAGSCEILEPPLRGTA